MPFAMIIKGRQGLEGNSKTGEGGMMDRKETVDPMKYYMEMKEVYARKYHESAMEGDFMLAAQALKDLHDLFHAYDEGHYS